MFDFQPASVLERWLVGFEAQVVFPLDIRPDMMRDPSNRGSRCLERRLKTWLPGRQWANMGDKNITHSRKQFIISNFMIYEVINEQTSAFLFSPTFNSLVERYAESGLS